MRITVSLVHCFQLAHLSHLLLHKVFKKFNKIKDFDKNYRKITQQAKFSFVHSNQICIVLVLILPLTLCKMFVTLGDVRAVSINA